MRFTLATIRAMLLTTVSALPKDCLSCAALCAYYFEWCQKTRCFIETRGSGSYVNAILGLDVDQLDKFNKVEKRAETLRTGAFVSSVLPVEIDVAAVPSTLVTPVKPVATFYE